MKGLKLVPPGFSAMAYAALRARRLQSPSMKDSKVYSGFSRDSWIQYDCGGAGIGRPRDGIAAGAPVKGVAVDMPPDGELCGARPKGDPPSPAGAPSPAERSGEQAGRGAVG